MYIKIARGLKNNDRKNGRSQAKAAETRRAGSGTLLASANSKWQPTVTVGRSGDEGRGGEFEFRWKQGKGLWVRTDKRRGRRLDWVSGKPSRTAVITARG